MDWVQAFTVIGVLGAFIFWLVNKLDSDIKTLGNRLDQHITAINARVDSANDRIDFANQRTDDLISLLIEHIKQQKDK